jgi:hypothetical protein
MSAFSVQPPFFVFADVDGEPLKNGYIYIGEPNLNAETNEKAAYWDKELTIPAAQPIRTIGGYPSRSGTPGNLYVDGDYSITVRNKNQTLVHSALTHPQSASAEFIQADDGAGGTLWTTVQGFINKIISDVGSSVIGFILTAANAVRRSVLDKLHDTISVKDFGAVGDGVTDDGVALNNAITFAANNNYSLHWPCGEYYTSIPLDIPEVSGGFWSENGLNNIGGSRNGTIVITDQDIVVFDLADFTNFRHMTVRQTGTVGTGKAFFSDNQVRFCTWEDVNVIQFKYSYLLRFTLWMGWRDVYSVNSTCGFRLSRNDDQENQTNPSAINSWNQGDGWFNNQLTFDNVLCNGGEVGIWGSMMGATINNVTCQNQETDGTTNDVLPVGEKGVGMWLEGGGTATDTFNNVIINYYVEDTLQPLIIKEHDSCVVIGWFTQGEAGGVSLLDIDGSSITISGQTGQAPGFVNRIKGVDSIVCSHGELVAPSTTDDLTNTLYSPTGVFPVVTKTATVTATPETSGTVDLSGAEDQIGWIRDGNTVFFSGRIDPSAVSSPVGTYLTIGGLPFQAANLNERAGNSTISVMLFSTGAQTVVPAIILENMDSFRIYMDVSTIVITDSFYVSGFYFVSD